ncbi:MAG TPA: hypothetical protein VEA99_19830 [Gemmatimonadaceae bacterium]|nr:hypothetical protein [Gemmatimonadaceae bacterium]
MAGRVALSRLRWRRGHGAHAPLGLTCATFESGAVISSVREAAGAEHEVAPGDHIPTVPDVVASLGRIAQLTRHVQLGPTSRPTGRRWLRGDEANETLPLPAIGSPTRPPWCRGALERFYTPGAPRTVEISVRRAVGGDADLDRRSRDE